jgi:hypothetical protein
MTKLAGPTKREHWVVAGDLCVSAADMRGTVLRVIGRGDLPQVKVAWANGHTGTCSITQVRKLLDVLRENAGFIAARKNKAGTNYNVLYRAEEQNISSDDGGKYAVVCEEHGSLVQTTNQRNARTILRYPDFCDCCEDRCGTSWSKCPTCGKQPLANPLMGGIA